MPSDLNRRTFMAGALAASAAGAGAAKPPKTPDNKKSVAKKNAMPTGKIGNMTVSRLLLGGNLLTHYTHSRDLKYVYNLAAHYNTDDKILETLAIAEEHGVDTLSIHTVPRALAVMRKHRKRGGKMKWIICSTAPITKDLAAYDKALGELVDMGTDAIYIWGVRSDPLAAQGKVDLIGEAVLRAKNHGLPSGVGAHDLNVIKQCEKHKVPADFYIKTFHHHNYPTGPKPNELKGPYSEIPGYWCKDPKETIEVMKAVTKPWISFKVMAAGAIPPQNAFPYVFKNGADHTLAGMFDFEIAQDAAIVRKAVASAAKRPRPWQS